jgi:polyribonucleotide nucleotidyltransferase
MGIVADPETGKIYDGKVMRLMEFGAFVEILPGKEGLVHISKLSRQHVTQVSDVLKEGQRIPVKLLEIDKMGRLNLSYIDAIDPDGAPPPSESRPYRQERPRYDRPRRDDRPRYR